tara:strand:+ start:7597 stop:7815 length:219 start_codon:yes stop_codon:yes gene_type:complete
MANQSYCRFTNTTTDLRDCVNALNNGIDVEWMSDEEIYNLKLLLEYCQEVTDLSSEIGSIIVKYNKLNNVGS